MPYRIRTFLAVVPDPFTHDRAIGLQRRLADAGAAA